MDASSAVYNDLSSDPTVIGLVSTRIYPRMIPQDASLPAIAYMITSDPREHNHQGERSKRTRVQIICVGRTYAEAHAVANAVESRFDGKRSFGNRSAAVFVENKFDRSEIGPGVLENGVQLDLQVIWSV